VGRSRSLRVLGRVDRSRGGLGVVRGRLSSLRGLRGLVNLRVGDNGGGLDNNGRSSVDDRGWLGAVYCVNS
jgi:hypothetical protein